MTEIDITGRYPATTQWVEVKRQTGTKDILVTPNIQLNAGAGGGGISSVGVNRHQSDNRSYKISLDSKQEAIVGQPVSLRWKFSDPNRNGVFYPPSMKLLVLVEKPTPNPAWFPFHLKLDWQLHVDLHNTFQQFMDGIQRLVAKPPVHEGWFFKIEGRYNHQAARAALRDAISRNPNPPTVVGLNAAARPWMDAEQQMSINSSVQLPA
ncbi:hypothetical protein FIBSPDRAFT_847772 [Athelia psychrophila]|uniref:Uncharacterized protein n=1 Tax=Athelia psychrophila TaxID=1759441 RepID=A0A166VY13_9AGAM|nr:hypothetical protein FIBSPDRAFT_847772 [Fibularhizoctonia sp. CBS 109695]